MTHALHVGGDGATDKQASVSVVVAGVMVAVIATLAAAVVPVPAVAVSRKREKVCCIF